jgi:hypothetical protein
VVHPAELFEGVSRQPRELSEHRLAWIS